MAHCAQSGEVIFSQVEITSKSGSDRLKRINPKASLVVHGFMPHASVFCTSALQIYPWILSTRTRILEKKKSSATITGHVQYQKCFWYFCAPLLLLEHTFLLFIYFCISPNLKMLSSELSVAFQADYAYLFLLILH